MIFKMPRYNHKYKLLNHNNANIEVMQCLRKVHKTMYGKSYKCTNVLTHLWQ